MKFKPVLGGVAVLTAATLALTACGRAEDASSGPSDAVSLDGSPAEGTITVWAMGAEGEALPEFVEAFEEANPDATVEVTAIPWDAAHNKFQTAIAGGTTPDVAMMGSTWMADFGDAFTTVPAEVDTTDFFPGALSTTEFDGRAAGVPWYVDTRVLYYRTDLAAEAGWEEAPTTWDDLKQMASDLQTEAGTDWGIRLPAGNDAFQGSMWMPWSAGAELTDGDAWTLDTPEMATGLAYYQSFFDEGLADPNADFSSGATESEFIAGISPMVVEGPFLRGSLELAAGEEFTEQYATAVLPAEEESVSFSGGANLVVFEGSDNAESAWKLVDWLSQPETQVSFYEATGDLPAAPSAWEDPALAGDASLETFGTQLETAKAPPVTTSWVQVAAKGDQALEQLRRGDGDVADVLATLQADADAIGLE